MYTYVGGCGSSVHISSPFAGFVVLVPVILRTKFQSTRRYQNFQVSKSPIKVNSLSQKKKRISSNVIVLELSCNLLYFPDCSELIHFFTLILFHIVVGWLALLFLFPFSIMMASLIT